MDAPVACALLALVSGAYDPVIDTALEPHGGPSIGAGVHRLQDDFGLHLRLASPRWLEDRLAVVLVGGIGWYPDLRALPMDAGDQDYDSRALYGQARLLAEVSTRLAIASGRLYATLGPSFLFLPSHLSTTRVGAGVYGAVGVELFAGDAYRAFPFSFYLEVGASAHGAAADVATRTGNAPVIDTTVDRPIATGFAIGGGIRFYLWR